jgi:hypothetical protein
MKGPAMSRRSKGERARATVAAWMPLDGRQAALLTAIGLIGLMFASLLH